MVACGDTIGSSGEAIMIQILSLIIFRYPEAARVHFFLDAYMHDLQNYRSLLERNILRIKRILGESILLTTAEET